MIANIIVPQLHNELLALVKCLRFSSNLMDMKSQYAKGNKPANSAYHQPQKCPRLAVFTLECQLLWAFTDLSQGVSLSFWGTGPILSLWNSFCVCPYLVPSCRYQTCNGANLSPHMQTLHSEPLSTLSCSLQNMESCSPTGKSLLWSDLTEL